MKLYILFLSALLLLGAPPISSHAEDNGKYLLSDKLYQPLQEIQKLMDENKYPEARTKLVELLTRDLSNYEKAVLNQTLGYIYNAMEQYYEALDAFITSLEFGALPNDVTLNLTYIIAQLHVQQGDLKQSRDYLETWLNKTPRPGIEAHIFAATVYYQLEQYADMVPHLKQALRISEDPENYWYEMLFVAYYELEQYEDASNTLVNMIKRFPEESDYLLYLANTYLRADNNRKAIAVYELADKKNLLTELEIKQLVNLYLVEDIPHKAALFLEEKLGKNIIPRSRENLDLLANSWIRSNEDDKALQVLNDIAQMSGDPDVYLRIGQIYFKQHRWDKAQSALEDANNIDDNNKNARANLLLGIAAYHNDKVVISNKALNKASTNQSTKQQAEWWLAKLNRKIETASKN
ncbi:MAG: tetratricopeptide repeat protein [Gammaproteobacteria bacterium]|nr:tetratricopeptide repeat protein [Gammaproteobacteria bacterium]NIN62692.1 tetratricopeptide repeat protein [Gammaproteobacteria bacterium]NIO63230.1 tetratricopeptide repeat protein [Gammaproteobacteria bacterium]NIQ11274.1 tetratricopeptide repeat protein [Gammaproteobacteria bacterium]NIQ20330.1 tetratricopeptide repeat protein [Gammaproteobacteria bacterium]